MKRIIFIFMKAKQRKKERDSEWERKCAKVMIFLSANYEQQQHNIINFFFFVHISQDSGKLELRAELEKLTAWAFWQMMNFKFSWSLTVS